MTKIKDLVVTLHEQHGEWCDIELAKAATCHSGYVRALAQANGWRLATRRSRGIEGVDEWRPYPLTPAEKPMARIGDALRAMLGEGT